MTKLDRYLLSQLMALFGFFALVLVSVYWVNRAVRLFDKLISDGQTAWVVLELTALTLPNVIALVLPVAGFAATLYVINRLAGESELVVMQAAGASPWRLARPVALFGLIVAVLMLALVHVLVPASKARLAARQEQVSQDMTARLLTAGSFQSPAEGVTLYIRDISELGELMDLFLLDARSDSVEITYTAKKALVVRSDAGPKLVMFEGMAQTLRTRDKALAITRFGDFTYDIGAMMGGKTKPRTDWDQVASWQLLSPDAALLATAKGGAGAARRELHNRLAKPLLAPAAALLGAALMMLGGFSRLGLWRQISLAILGLIGLQFLDNAVDATTRRAADLSWLYYLVPVAGLAVAALALWWAGHPRRPARPAAAKGQVPA